MANFMGPMAPPQAAPSQPPQLDIRTNPGQRAQFKSFMQGMQVPPTTAPVAPMLPAPTPMDDIDIFAPAPMADGGVVGGLQNLGQMSDQMVDALNTVVYGGGQGGGCGGGQMPPPLPPIDNSFPQQPMDNQLGIGSPLSRLGMMGGLGSIFGYEDGGPVGMQRGGVTFKSGERFESGRGIAEQQAERRARNESYFGDISSDRGSEPPSGGGDDGGSEPPITKDDPITQAEVDAAFGASNNFDPSSGSVLTGTLVSDPAPAANIGPSGQIFAPTTPITEESGQRAIDAVMSIPGVASVAPISAPIIDLNADVFAIPVMEQIAQEQRARRSVEDSGVGGPIGSDNVIFSGVEDTSVEGPLAEAGSSVDRLMVTPITNLRGGGQRTAGEDLTMRSESGIAKKLPQNVIENINKGRPAVIDARSGQITGYVGEGLFGIGNAYTGRPGYDPFGPNATFDPARNAYIVQPDIMSNVGAPASDDRVLSPTILPPATDPADTTPPPLMITPPTTGLPPSGPSPTDVLVPSTRTNVPITAPSLLPTQGVAPTFLPQSFLDLLANFNRPAPVAMQDGGAVLDKAADNFLEALKVA